jgi:hypothetical protein
MLHGVHMYLHWFYVVNLFLDSPYGNVPGLVGCRCGFNCVGIFHNGFGGYLC